MRLLYTFMILLAVNWSSVAQTGTLKGTITDEKNNPVQDVNIVLPEINVSVTSDVSGNYVLENLTYGKYMIRIGMVGFTTQTVTVKIDKPITVLNKSIMVENSELDQVEVFGVRNKQPDKLQNLTRLPLKPSEQIQSISVISEKVIEQQGALTITEATRNVPGVYAFASYGNKRESMGSRGYRGIPILKNGVRVNSDFRGIGIITDAAGIDNIQVLKGVAAITQGVATDIGSPGGVINIVTKTPKFHSGGSVSMRAGSWGFMRPQFDVYGPIDDNEKIAFRINGAYETKDSYRSQVSGERLYVNPSLAWRANDKTTITVEMDYLDDSRTPDVGTINLAGNDTYAIYNLPNNQFLGFNSDRTITQNATYSVRLDRKINDVFSVKASYFKSDLDIDDRGAVLAGAGSQYNLRKRSYNESTRKDMNEVLQLDLVAQDLQTGSIKHTFQIGMDYNKNSVSTTSGSSATLDTINVFAPINNDLSSTNAALGALTIAGSTSRGLGLLAQGVTTWNRWVKTFVGVRYSSVETTEITTLGVNKSDAWNPLGGIMITPIKNVNFFASYTNSSNPRSATRRDVNGSELGNERWDQLEAGWKTSWINDRLRFNVTFFKINNKDMNLPTYDENWVATGYFQKGGNDQRQGIEAELSGRILPNLEVITGYSYIDAKYKEHTSYVYNSSPLNTPKHTFNAWANYTFVNNDLEGLSLAAGVYYIGDRPMNDWSSGPVTHEGIIPGQKPFDMKAYTVVNFQAGYAINRHWDVRVLVNNVFDEMGYNAYRTSYINQIDPVNYAGVLTYRF
ncbi:TonB-dependent receptor [Flavobacterium kingsejongi]|uniref:TonB-dependent siderophore receptor n=1 Tax=Flavobacterium kingsejongi TaxID=1678728 RepID=A0A2S1LLM7_9FLAO|nr:TonB-dependent receptor [Flavobacterium kingsejongi]AWG24655.1 TonB-dependent siderophore receptor [Flavobacterium kingsejongi]